MRCSKEALATEACIQANYCTIPLVGSLYRLGCGMLRATVRPRRPRILKQAACQTPPPFSSVENQNPSPNDDLPCWRHLNLVRESHPRLSSICGWLEEGDIQMTRGFPFGAGGFTDLWRGSLDGRQVAIKSYRRYLSTEPSLIFMRFSQEALICSSLSHKNIVSFIGIYVTIKHPFSLVFDLAGHLDLRYYLRTHATSNRLELLVGIARGLHHMHDLDIIHGRLETTNILVDLDGTARIAGLGSALILDQTTPRSEMSVEWLFRGSAPELMCPQEFGLSFPYNSKPSDIFAFGVLAWEVFTGRPVFSSNLDVVAVYTMWKGARPPRPDCPQVTDQMWKMMERCWERTPSKRTTIKEIVQILEAECKAKSYNTL